MKKFFVTLFVLTSLSQAKAYSSSCQLKNFLLMIEDEYTSGIEQCIKTKEIYVNQRLNDSGETPLMYAALAGKEKSLRKLIELGAGVKIKSSQGNTALHYALNQAEGGTKTDKEVLKIVKTLAATKADFEEKNSREQAPLIYGVTNGFFETAEYAFSLGAKRTYGHFYSTAYIVSEENIKFLENYFKNGFSVNPPEEKNPVLLAAVCNPDIEILKYIVSKGADIHYTKGDENIINRGTNKLFCPEIQEKNLSYLIDLGVDVNLNPEILFRLIEMGDLSNLTFSLNFNRDPKLFDTRLLPLMRKILEKGANPNSVRSRWTPLLLLGETMGLLGASYDPFGRSDRSKEISRYIPIAELLIEFGADKSLTNKDGKTAYDLYVGECDSRYSKTICNPEVVKLLKP